MTLEKPDWNNELDRELYFKLFYSTNKKHNRTKKEDEFISAMYHLEEFYSGLDG